MKKLKKVLIIAGIMINLSFVNCFATINEKKTNTLRRNNIYTLNLNALDELDFQEFELNNLNGINFGINNQNEEQNQNEENSQNEEQNQNEENSQNEEQNQNEENSQNEEQNQNEENNQNEEQNQNEENNQNQEQNQNEENNRYEEIVQEMYRLFDEIDITTNVQTNVPEFQTFQLEEFRQTQDYDFVQIQNQIQRVFEEIRREVNR